MIADGDTDEDYVSLKSEPVIVVPVLADAERELLEAVSSDWQLELDDNIADMNGREAHRLLEDPDTLRALARWAEARQGLANFLAGIDPIENLEPWADLYEEAMRNVLERRED